MSLYLGNLSIEEIESRAGFEFPQKLHDYMKSRRQQSANNIKQGEWHCFDIPFVLVCGDIETATDIHNLGSKRRMERSVMKSDLNALLYGDFTPDQREIDLHERLELYYRQTPDEMDNRTDRDWETKICYQAR